jgi:hypothetical protein
MSAARTTRPNRARMFVGPGSLVWVAASGILAAAILLDVREFAAGALTAVLGMAAVGFSFGFILRAAHGVAAPAIVIGGLVLLIVFGAVLFAVDSAPNAIVVSGLGLVFLSAAEGTRRVLVFRSKRGLK